MASHHEAAGAMTPAAALALYEQACREHKRALWRRAAHALAECVKAAEQAQAPAQSAPVAAQAPARPLKPEPRPVGLLEFLSRYGIRDDGGELSARDAEWWHRAQPFRRRLIRPDGVSLEHAAQLAWEAGYFPGVPCPKAAH